ncbi:MAG: acyltransferase family protein [Candidatus Dormibacteria bacterium]
MTAGAGVRPIRARLLGADAVRAVAMLGVIGVHAAAWGPSATFHSIDVITRYSVPAFVLLTGVVIAYSHTGRRLGTGFARRRLARTLLPWVAWAPVFVAFSVLTGTLRLTVPDIGGFVVQGGGHLWFLLLVPQLYLLFVVWPRNHRWALAAAAMLVQIGLCVMRLYAVLPGWQSQLVLNYAAEIFPFWVGYFAVGLAMGTSLRRPGGLRRALNVWRLQLTIGAAAATVVSGAALLLVRYPGSPYAATYLTGTGAFLNPALPLLVLSAVATIATVVPPLLRRSRLLTRAVTSVSEQSLAVYIVHPVPLFFLGTYLLEERMAVRGVSALMAFAALVLFTLISSLVVVRLLRTTRAATTLGLSQRPLTLPFAARSRVPQREEAA